MMSLVLTINIFINFVILGTTGQDHVNTDKGTFALAVGSEVAYVTPGGEVKVGCSTPEPVDPNLYILQWVERRFGGNSLTKIFASTPTFRRRAKKQILSLNTTYKHRRTEGESDLWLVCQCLYNSTSCGQSYITLWVVNSTSSTDVIKSTGRATQSERQRRAEVAIAKVKQRQVLSSGAVVVCAVGLIASVLWGKTSKGPVSWFRPCERIRFLRLHSSGGDSRKPSQDSGIVGTMPRTIGDEGHSSCDTSASSSPGSSTCTGTSSGCGVGSRPELMYAELMHAAPSVVFVPRPDAAEYVEIIGVLKDNQI